MHCTAICVTGKTQYHVDNFLPRAVECFEAQSYPDKSMVIVSTLPLLGDYGGEVDKRAIYAPQGMSLGALRNLGLDAAERIHGQSLVVQWDDDDYSHPDRMAIQVAAWHQTQKPVFLQRQLCYSFSTDTAFVRDYVQQFIHGTILHQSAPDIRYPEQSKAEDTAFLKHWPEFAVLDNDPALYIRFEHGRNTWTYGHVMRQYASEWAVGHWHLGDPHRAYLREVLAKYPVAPIRTKSA